jgi:osmoprotectant transport system substrate-binding protein
MRRSRTFVLGATVLALALFAGACASGGDDDGGQPSDGGTSSAPAEKGDLTVGVSGAFPESQLVAEMYAQLLENAGYTVDRQLDLGTRQLSDKALFSGEIDMKPEYLGFELPELDPEADTTGNAEEIAALLAPLLEAKGVKLLGYSEANSTNAFVVTQETAESLGVSTMSDLAPIAGDLTLGGPPECPENALCIPGLKKAYGIEFGDFKPLDFGGPQTVAAIDAGAVDVGLLFSLDPTIEDKGWVVLADDQELQAAGNFAGVIRDDVTNPEIEGILNSVTTTLTDEGMREIVARVAIDKEDVATVATDYLQEQGLL